MPKKFLRAVKSYLGSKKKIRETKRKISAVQAFNRVVKGGKVAGISMKAVRGKTESDARVAKAKKRRGGGGGYR